jgi:hypothetical protein
VAIGTAEGGVRTTELAGAGEAIVSVKGKQTHVHLREPLQWNPFSKAHQRHQRPTAPQKVNC